MNTLRRPRPLAAGLTAVLAVGALTTTAAAAERPTCGGRAATLVGTEGPDRLTGTAGPDVIVARGGADVVRGGGGRDLICGGTGADLLVGGGGDDRLEGGLGQTGFPDGALDNDRFVPGPGDDVVDAGPRQRRAVPDRVDYSGSDGPVRVDLRDRRATGQGEDRFAGSPALRVVGSPYDDELRGGRTGEELAGGAGDDLVVGGGGTDYLDDGAGDDVLRGGAGDDGLTGGAGDDELVGGAGGDQLSDSAAGSRGRNGVNALRGGRGDDDLTLDLLPRAGHVLDGGPGRDSVYFETPGEATRWRMDLATGVATVAGVAGTSTVTALEYLSHQLGKGVWTVVGTDADETVVAAYSRLVARLGGGDDTVFSGARDDRVDGGDGDDSAATGRGRDTCVSVEDVSDCERVS